MDFTLFDKAQEQFGLVSGHTDKLKGETLKLKHKLRSYEDDAAKLIANTEEIDALKKKYSRLVDERDQLIMERELMSKRVGKMVTEIDLALEQETKAE